MEHEYNIYHVCIFTQEKNTEFLVCGGENEDEIMSNLAKEKGNKAIYSTINKLVYQKTYLLKSEGLRFENSLKNDTAANKRKLVIEDNPSFANFTKNLRLI
jgi:predicted GIY-YIG superfamily endonuclease